MNNFYVDNITSKGITLNSEGKSMQIKVYEDKIYQLQSNWNSLREWLENNEDDTFTAKVIYDVVLDKMNELEGVKND